MSHFLYLLYYSVCLSVCVSVYVSVHSNAMPEEDRKRVLHLLDLEQQAVVSLLIWLPGIEFRSSARTAHSTTLHHLSGLMSVGQGRTLGSDKATSFAE